MVSPAYFTETYITNIMNHWLPACYGKCVWDSSFIVSPIEPNVVVYTLHSGSLFRHS